MYLHLGGDTVIPDKSILAVFDLDTSTISKYTLRFLRQAEEMGQVITLAEDIPKSFVVCIENKKTAVYITQIAASTIAKRLKYTVSLLKC